MENDTPKNESIKTAADREDWIEVRKECEVNQDGTFTAKKVTLEKDRSREPFTRKERFEVFFKIIGIMAIFIPIIIFSLNRNADASKQAELFKFEAYSAMRVDLRIILNKSIYIKEYKDAKDELFLKLYPKFQYINNQSMVAKVDTFQQVLYAYELISEIKAICDTLTQTCISVSKYNNDFFNSVHINDAGFYNNTIMNLDFYKEKALFLTSKSAVYKKKSEELKYFLSSAKQNNYPDSVLLQNSYALVNDTLGNEYLFFIFLNLNNLINRMENTHDGENLSREERIKVGIKLVENMQLWNFNKMNQSYSFDNAIVKFKRKLLKLSNEMDALARDLN